MIATMCISAAHKEMDNSYMWSIKKYIFLTIIVIEL